MLKNRSKTTVASQSDKNNNTALNRMQLGSYQIPRLVEQRHSISSTAAEDYVADDDSAASIVNGCRTETDNNVRFNRNPHPSNVPNFSLTFLNPVDENANPYAPENSKIVQNGPLDKDSSIKTQEVVSEISNGVLNDIDSDRRFGIYITNQTSSTSSSLINARKRSRTTFNGNQNLKSPEAEASPPKKLARPLRERTSKENVNDFNPTNVENQLPKTPNESLQTPTDTNVSKKRARERTAKKSVENSSESLNSSSNLKTPASRSRKPAKFFDGTPKIVFLPKKSSKQSKKVDSATRKTPGITRTKEKIDDKVVEADFSNPTRSRTSVTKTPVITANTEVSKDNAANLNRSRTVPNRSRTRTTKSTIEYDCKIIGDQKVFNVKRKLLSEKSIGFKTLFEANSEESIEIEGIPDKTMELAIEFCHGFALKDIKYSETFSLLFFAIAWEIADLKKLIEERLLKKMNPSNVVNIANAAIIGNSKFFENSCKEFILLNLKNGQKIRSFPSLDDKFRKEIEEELLKDGQNG